MSNQLSLLFSPLTIRGLSLRNRINMAPMVTNYATSRGEVTDRLIAYYAARARGGAGLITVEATAVSPNGRSFVNNLCVYDDLHVPGLRALVAAVHAAGAKISLELYHAGRRSATAIIRSQPVGPSAVPAKGGEVPRELSLAEIERLQEEFVQAARRAKAAGFDAVTLHAAHGYLINAFLSPLANKRSDGYGGDLRGRARFGLEVLWRVRAAVGDDFPIIYRLCGSEYVDGGLTHDEAKQVARWFAEAGADAIDVSAGTVESAYITSAYMFFPRGLLVPLAEGIKRAVPIPVFAVGRIADPIQAEQTLAAGQADGITMGRALLADPELPNKAREGRFDEITPCIACNQGCLDRIALQLDVACLVNPATGREQYADLPAAPAPKKVLVVGGGLAGMQAALTARRRGHAVTLYERSGRLGGQFHLAAAAPGKRDALAIVEFLARQLERAGVEINLGSEVTPAKVDELHPDAVIVATGARPTMPAVPGAERAVSAWGVLAGTVDVGRRVVIVGGGQVGCETAEFLAERGREVTVIEMLPDLAVGMGARTREVFLGKLIDRGVNFLTRATLTAIGEREITFTRAGLAQRMLDVDTVVMAIGSQPAAELAEALRAKGYAVQVVGDAVRPRSGLEAIHEGFLAGAAV